MEMEEAPARLRGKPSWLISKASARAHRLIAEAMAAAGGRAYHFAILAALDEFGPDSQVRIGQRCGIDQSDMNAMVNELTGQGHVARAVDPSDRRRNLITLTPGSVSLDLSEDRRVLYVHAMYIDGGDVEAYRRSVKEGLERRVLELLR